MYCAKRRKKPRQASTELKRVICEQTIHINPHNIGRM